MPVRPGSFEYRFSPEALKRVRDRLDLSQAKLAARLDLPVNTISRWERGETTPDAHSLAAIYSLAKERGLEPEFFQKGVGMATATRKKPPEPLNGRVVLNRQRTRLVMAWDFQNVALDAAEAFDVWFYMDKFLDIAFPSVDKWVLRAYASWQHNEAVKTLRYIELEQTYFDADAQISREVRNLCGIQNSYWSQPSIDPKDTVLVLVSKDGDFADLLNEVRQAGVDVYLWAPPGCSRELQGAVNKTNIIPWNHPRRVVSEDNLKHPSG